MTREQREAKVLRTVTQWLPQLGEAAGGTKIEIEILDPSKNNGALFTVARSPVPQTFACRR